MDTLADLADLMADRRTQQSHNTTCPVAAAALHAAAADLRHIAQMIRAPHAGDIGEEGEEIVVEPIELPNIIPVPAPAPVPVPA